MLAGVVAIAVVALVLMSVPGLLHAQSKGLRAEIPFAFYVGRTLLPAGTYEMQMRGDALQISDGEGHNANVICNVTNNQDARRDNSILFHGYGNSDGRTWFLAGLSWQDSNIGRETVPTSAERELVKSFAVYQVAVAMR
jgi:hypothetical protein